MALHVRGVVLPDDEVRDLWLVGDRVSAEPVPGAQTVVDRGFLLPGLVDAHCHLGIRLGETPITSLAEAKALADLDRDAGVLAIRDAGSPYPYPELDDDPDVPRLARSGRHIAPVKRYLRGIGVEVPAEEVAATVTTQAAAGNGWVKLVGDWIDRDAGDLGTQWPVDVLTEAIAAAHEEGARVTAHCFGEQSLRDFAAAGTDCIEHATGLLDDTIGTFAEQRIAIVPTLVNIANFPAFAAAGEAKFPAYAAHMRDLYERRYETVAKAHEAGVPVYVGTDAGGQLPHGLAAQEVEALTRAGLTTVEAIGAATWAAREWLGRPGIAEGESADLVVYRSDPREDVRVLAEPHRVVLRGVTY